MKGLTKFITGTVLATVFAGVVWAHCEIPCGIYGDKTRIDVLYEHVATIEKSMKSIKDLSGKTDAADVNQLVRWIANKDEHANEIQEIVTQYFMTQRVKPKTDEAGHKKYLSQLTALHEMLISAMKCKQTVDARHAANLKDQIDRFSAAYFSAEDLEHIREHHPKEGR